MTGDYMTLLPVIYIYIYMYIISYDRRLDTSPIIYMHLYMIKYHI